MTYTLELDDADLSVVVEAVKIQTERWNETRNAKIADPNSLAWPLDEIDGQLRRHEALLARLPDFPMTTSVYDGVPGS